MTNKINLLKILGDYPLIKVLNYLLIYRDLDYSLTDIAEGSEVAWSPLNLLWPKLEEMQLVIHTREVGKAKMFRLNTDNDNVKELVRFADNLVWQNAGKELAVSKISSKRHKVLVH